MALSQPEGFLAAPPNGTGPGVLVLHAWWGLNESMKAFCTRLAQSGFTAFAPDLYRGKVAATIDDAEILVKSLDDRQTGAEIGDAAAFLLERAGNNSRGLSVIGFSLGAYFALELAATAPDLIHSVVLFYGTGPVEHSRSRASYLGHFGEDDAYEPASSVDELEESLKEAGRPVTFHRYSGTGHWFFEPDRPAYNAAAASLAWERTLQFLQDG